ncbi:MAG: PAS domain S-box protein [Caldisericia bacterium]|jgi:PAS domain S-box-containing protein/putative nucleotidyltransferase with HDIG domain|nr:PAS domain S-box protein [Caldisericia bacterium]
MDIIYYNILNSVREITLELLKSQITPDKILFALRKVGEGGNFDRAIFFEKEDDVFNKKYEWIRDDSIEKHDDKIKFDKNEIELLKKDETLNFKNCVIFPLFIKDNLIGVIKFEILKEKREISPFDIYALKGGIEVIEASLEREELIKNLKNQKEFLEKVVNNVKELITIQDKDLTILFANKSAGDSVNKDPTELIGKRCFEIWHKREVPCINCPVQKAFMTKRYEEGEIETPDGRVWFIKGIPLIDNNGEVQYVVESTIEITKEKEYIRKLRESEERYEKILNSTNVGFSILDKEGKYIYVNKKRAEILGYKEGELLNKKFEEIVHPEDVNKDKELYQKLVNGEIDSYTVDLRFIRKDGNIAYNRVYVARVNDEKGNFLYTVNAIVDITKEVQYSIDLKEKEEIFKGIFDQFSIGVNLIDTNGKVISSNEALQKMLGYSIDELRNLTFKDYSHKEELEKNIELFESAKRGEIEGYTLEKRFIRKDGSVFWGKITSNPIKDENGKIKYFITLVEDIDDRVRYYENLKIEENRLRAIIDVIPDLIFIFDKNGNFLNYHGDLRKLLLKPEDFLGKNISQIFNKEIAERAISSIKKALKENIIPSFIYELPCPYNRDEICFYEARFVKLDKDKVLALIRDVSESIRNFNLLKKKEEELNKSFYQTINLLSKIVEMKEPFTAGHQKRTSEYAVLIAKEMDLSNFKIESVKIAGLVHDIGKIELPIEILNKPTKLSPIDWDFVKKHPEIGYEILKEIDFPWNIKDIVLQHHERIDGSGYPLGLKDDEILIEARIISVADSIEAMSSHRPYRPRLSREEIINELIKYKGSYYDHQVVDIALKLIEEGKINI